MDRNSLLQALLWAVSFFSVLIAAISINMWLTDDGFGESARIFQVIVTAIAIFMAAAFAVFKLQIFRVFAPHLTISQRVSHRPVGESYIHIDVSATLQNSSRVKVELRKGFYLLQQIAPVEDQDVEDLYAQVFVDKEIEDILWPKLYEVHRSWEESVLIIEPGEIHQEVCEFIVTRGVESVLIYAFFYDSVSSNPAGWYSTTIYDIS